MPSILLHRPYRRHRRAFVPSKPRIGGTASMRASVSVEAILPTTTPAVVPIVEHRHWTDQLVLSLQRREVSYNVALLEWNADTATMMTDMANDTPHELWDDQVLGRDLVRLNHVVSTEQVITQQSVRLTYTEPHTKPHTLAGLLGLSLGQVGTQQLVFPATPWIQAYEHTITMAPPSALPSISARTCHQQSRYYLYGGIKGDGWTLQNNGPYLQFMSPLIGSGSRLDVTDTVLLTAVLVFGPPFPTSHAILDGLGVLWYLFPDSAGGLSVSSSAPPGTAQSVGHGLSLRASTGTRYQLGVESDGTPVLTALSTEPGHILDVCGFTDSIGVVWYVWIAEEGLTLDTTLPAGASILPIGTLPGGVPVVPEAWLRWGDCQIYLRDVTAAPLNLPPPAPPTEPRLGTTSLGAGTLTLSNRVINITVQQQSGLQAAQAYRNGTTPLVRSNFYAPQPLLTVTLTLQVDPTTEAAELQGYLVQRNFAVEWQCVGARIDPVSVTNLTTGTPPNYHTVLDTASTPWYLFVTPEGEISLAATPPAGTGLAVGTGITLRAFDGYRYAIGATPEQEVLLTQIGFVSTLPLTMEFCVLRDTNGVSWYLWINSVGELTVSQTPISATAPFRFGFSLILPRVRWKTLLRKEQFQFDLLELTGSVLDDGVNPPILARVYNQQPAYLR